MAYFFVLDAFIDRPVQRGALVVVQVVASSRKHLVECNELDYLPLAASTGGSILANGEVLPRRNVQQDTTPLDRIVAHVHQDDP